MRHIACGPHPGGPPGYPLAVDAKRQDATSKKPPFQGAQSTLSGRQDDECCEQERCGCPKSAKAKHQAALKRAQLFPCDQILCHDLLRGPCHDLCLSAREACLFKPLGMFLCVEGHHYRSSCLAFCLFSPFWHPAASGSRGAGGSENQLTKGEWVIRLPVTLSLHAYSLQTAS